MGVFQITIEADNPPEIFLGQTIAGGKVKELKEVAGGLLSASKVAELYGVSVQTVHRKLVGHNQGTQGKYLYHSEIAKQVFSGKDKRNSKPGAKRKN